MGVGVLGAMSASATAVAAHGVPAAFGRPLTNCTLAFGMIRAWPRSFTDNGKSFLARSGGEVSYQCLGFAAALGRL
jgi:hypothetical protein